MGRPLGQQPRLPDMETLNALLTYDDATGALTWRDRGPSSFAEGYGAMQGARWKARYAGRPAGGMAGGYHRVMIDGKHHLSHRIIWKMKMGEDPIFIDHIDGNKSNNRLENLRNVEHVVNMKNKSLYRNNKSGFPGVEFHKRDGAWIAKIGVDGKQIQLGSFASKEEAIAARIAGQAVLDYHANHGRPSDRSS